MKSEKISSSIIFVGRRFNGYYRFKNEFQIYPVDVSLKGVANLHMPLRIEFRYDPSNVKFETTKPKQVCITDHESSLIREYLLLLTVFSQYNFFQYTNSQSWFYPLSSEGGTLDLTNFSGYNERIKSCWGQRSYFGDINTEHVTLKEESFSELSLPIIEKENSETYFNTYGRRLNSESVNLPDQIDFYFSKYFGFRQEQKESFLSAASLFKSGLTLRDSRSHLSLSFASFISAIETLIAHDYKDKKATRCKECGLERHQVSKKFKEFFKFYINKEKGLLKYAKRLYSIRSRIHHGGQLFLSDLTQDHFDDILEIEHLIRLIRISLINWLLKSHTRTL